ncbi:MAG: phosphoribosylamine--glycine ligase [Gemmatimonadaceae bacterium]
MRVLIIGGGSREHALAWKLSQDNPEVQLVAAPGNPGMAELAHCVPLAVDDTAGLSALAESERVALTVVGPEASLAAGIVDHFRDRRLAVFGPTARAATIETSKSYAKQVMVEAGVPTARAMRHVDAASAKRSIREFGAPVVVKASGLAAGKGVIVCQTVHEADSAIDAMLTRGDFGDAGAEVLVEEHMEGEELSFFAISDGDAFIPLLPAQDHKRLFDGDAGPNTGGMGAYAPVSLATAKLVEEVGRQVFSPTLAALNDRGRRFTGLLYAGLMLTEDGPKVIEFNARFGDPETQAILPLMRSSLLDLLMAVATEDSLAGTSPVSWRPLSAVTTVLAASGYPDAPRRGDPIMLPPPPFGVHVFHAGTQRSATGELITAGGRVASVTGLGPDFASAAARSRAYADAVVFAGKQMRYDIGRREQARIEAHARAS